MKILLVINGFNQGGAEIGLYKLLSKIDEEFDVSIDIVCLYRVASALALRYEKTFKVTYLNNNLGYLSRIFHLKSIIKKHKGVHVISSLPQATMLCRFLKIVHSYRLYSFEHSEKYDGKFGLFLITLTDFMTDYFMADSLVVKSAIESRLALWKKKVNVVPLYFIDNDVAQHKNFLVREKMTNCLVVSRIDLKNKKICEVIRGLSNFREINLTIIGEGKDKPVLERLVNTLEMEERVTFLGFKENWYEIAKSFDVFISISNREGLGITILEAMSLGLPVIASPVGEVPNYIKHMVNGILVDSGDINGFIKQITDLKSDIVLRKRLSGNGMAYVSKNYSFEQASCLFFKAIDCENKNS